MSEAAEVFYAEMAETATELLEEFGAVVHIKRGTTVRTDPVTGAPIAGVPATDFYPNGILGQYPIRMIDGTRIQEGDRMLVLDNTVQPVLTDVPNAAGQDWTVVNVRTVAPIGSPLVHFVQVRA